MKINWMAELANHYERIRYEYPNDRLIILFDIDDTIIDIRYLVLHVLQAFDRDSKTNYFHKFKVEDITVHENQVDRLVARLPIPVDKQKDILDYYNKNRWSWYSILQTHHPFHGVLEVIRWFQIQPNTFVGLNTGRPELVRNDTLKILNKLGEEFKVHFINEILHMNPRGWEQEVENAKISGLRYFQKLGYRIFAFIDNEPKNLKAVSRINPNQEILLLHSNTIFEHKRIRLPSYAVKGKRYDLTELIPEKALPKHIQFVWHGINDEVNLRQFLTSDILWGECDVRMDPVGDELILRHDSFKKTPLDIEEEWLEFDRLLGHLYQKGKSIKIDLKAGDILIQKVLDLLTIHGFEDSRLWFNGNVERLQRQGFEKLAKAHPNAILQCPVDFLAPLICSVPDKAKEILDIFTSWGMNRFSINWLSPNLHLIFDQMDDWGLDVNIYNVPDLESFLQAVLLMPRSITSDFNFPKWHYYGRGSGQLGLHYEYTMKKANRRRQI